MNRTLRCALAGAVMVVGSVAGAGPAQPGTTQPAGMPADTPATQADTRPAVVLPLSRVPAKETGRYTLEQVKAMFPTFEHAPYETAGYNHLTLPFLYEDRSGGSGDANEAKALSFLMSFALDWGQGGYCSYHAYFTFQRARRYMVGLSKQYDAQKIRFAIDDWGSTHALGGTLVRHKDGFGGKLVFFAPSGEQVRQYDYAKPREYFDLLGDMAVDALKYLGHEPGAELVKHLHLKQCKDLRCLSDLGKAAFAEEGSAREFACYEAALLRDPDFAIVRSYWAVRKWWSEQDDGAKAGEYAKSMSSYLDPLAVEDFEPEKCQDKEAAGLYVERLEQARLLSGPDAPWILEKDLERAMKRKPFAPDLQGRALRVAAKHPNSYWLVRELANSYSWGGPLDHNSDLACSLDLMALQNRYQTGVGHKQDAFLHLADCAARLGRMDLAVQLLLPDFSRQIERRGAGQTCSEAQRLGAYLFDMGRFDESWQWYRQAYKTSKAGSRIAIDSLVGGAVSAAHAGREDIVRQILRDRRPLLDQHHATGLLEGYLDVLAGRKMNYKAVWSRPENDIQWWLDDRLQTLTMQADILEGQPGHWKWAEDNLSICMHRREYAVLLHAFYQKHPRLASDCFYRAMEWLYPDDAWVRQAVAEYRDGGAKGEVIPPAKVLEKLKDYPPVRRATGAPARSSASWQLIKDLRAGAVAAAVRESLAAGKLDQAEELALRYYNLCASAVNYRPRAHAGHLVYLVEQARKAMKSALGPNDL